MATPLDGTGDFMLDNAWFNYTRSNLSYLGAWANDFKRESFLFQETPADFVQEFVPSCKRYSFHKRDFSLFCQIPLDKDDSGLCGSLIPALSALVAKFSRDRRPTFSVAASEMFRTLSESEQPTLSSIVISLPQSNATTSQNNYGCPTAVCLIEAKGQAQQDPFDEDGDVKTGRSHTLTVAQLAKAGRDLLAGNSSCFSFVLGVYGHTARIFRFDRAGVIVSKAFDYVTSPHILGKFLWQLVHPQHSAGVVGSDPTLSRPTQAEKSQMLKLIRQHYPEIPEDEVVRHARWIRASLLSPSDTSNSPPTCNSVRCFTVGAPISESANLFCRGTVIWRVLIEGQGHKLYSLKDSWREEHYRPDLEFYDLIEVNGLARSEGNLDLGATEPKDSGHITCSATSWGEMRIHMRTLTYPIGPHPRGFVDLKPLVVALQTAIESHKLAWESGVLDRDTSFGNLLLSDEPGLKGCLFDYSAAIPLPGSPSYRSSTLSEITGTFEFMAMDMLISSDVESPLPQHDLESFYWVFVWILLRHANHDQEPSTFRDLFGVKHRCYTKDAKYLWLWDSRVVIKDNDPLTWLLDELTGIFRVQATWRGVGVTHEELLDIIGTALKMGGWPKHDATAPLVGVSKGEKDVSPAKSSRREADAAPDGSRKANWEPVAWCGKRKANRDSGAPAQKRDRSLRRIVVLTPGCTLPTIKHARK